MCIMINFDLTFPKQDLSEVYLIIFFGNNFWVITDEFYDGAVLELQILEKLITHA